MKQFGMDRIVPFLTLKTLLPTLLTINPGKMSSGENILATVTCVAQDRHLKEKSQPITRKDIATALHKQNLLRLTVCGDVTNS